MFALSLKQPWATLLVHGLKTMRWRGAGERGRILIHAARVPDERPAGVALVPPELLAEARRGGGILGQGDLLELLSYRTAEEFAADRKKHLNDPSWFQKPVMYGFVFANLSTLSFREYPGWMRFFPVDLPGLNKVV